MIGKDTIVAPATPPGESALALARVSGPESHRLVTSVFGVPSPVPRRAYTAYYKDVTGKEIDEVVFIYYKEKASYTGDPMVEISTHGNPFIVRKVIEDLLRRGCRAAEPGEFTRNAFLNGRMDLSQAEAVIDLIRARSDRALEIAQKQLDGATGRAVQRLADRLVDVLARCEAYLDFPEEDLPPEDGAEAARNLSALSNEVETLAGTQGYGEVVREGVRTVIFGPPNAGKSSLLNALLGEDRAIVHKDPGTTRDYIEAEMRMGPYLFRLIDTAGLRETDAEAEWSGVEKTKKQIAEACMKLLVLDSAAEDVKLPEAFNLTRTIVVENKTDLPGSRHLNGIPSGLPRSRVSALKGNGIDELRHEMKNLLESDMIIPDRDAIVVGTRHAQALRTAKDGLNEAARKFSRKEPLELIASDLRDALDALGEITGRIDNEQVLDRVFASFCIGK